MILGPIHSFAAFSHNTKVTRHCPNALSLYQMFIGDLGANFRKYENYDIAHFLGYFLHKTSHHTPSLDYPKHEPTLVLLDATSPPLAVVATSFFGYLAIIYAGPGHFQAINSKIMILPHFQGILTDVPIAAIHRYMHYDLFIVLQLSRIIRKSLATVRVPSYCINHFSAILKQISSKIKITFLPPFWGIFLSKPVIIRLHTA